MDVVLQRYTEAVHEGRAGSDGVAVPGLRLVLLGNLRVGGGGGSEGVAVASGFRGCLWKWPNGPPHSKTRQGVAVATPQIRHERHVRHDGHRVRACCGSVYSVSVSFVCRGQLSRER